MIVLENGQIEKISRERHREMTMEMVEAIKDHEQLYSQRRAKGLPEGRLEDLWAH